MSNDFRIMSEHDFSFHDYKIGRCLLDYEKCLRVCPISGVLWIEYHGIRDSWYILFSDVGAFHVNNTIVYGFHRREGDYVIYPLEENNIFRTAEAKVVAGGRCTDDLEIKALPELVERLWGMVNHERA